MCRLENPGCKYSTTTCAAPASTRGYVVTEVEVWKVIFKVGRGIWLPESLRPGVVGSNRPLAGPKAMDFMAFLVAQVQALCAPGFVGAAKVESCDRDLGAYKCLVSSQPLLETRVRLSGCSMADVCTTPEAGDSEEVET